VSLFVIVVVCTGLWLLFPKGFKFMVGTWVGFCGGGFFWGLTAMLVPALITLHAFVGFLVAGIVAGCFFAAKG
jgi:hypothetical protein